MNENTLSQRERYILSALASSPDEKTAQRAQVLLKWARGETRESIAQATNMRPAQVQHWTRSFIQKRLEVFAPSEVERAAKGMAGLTSVNALLKQYHVEPNHPRYVATLALQLFDETQMVHQLPRACRSLLATAALLHTVGMGHDGEDYQRAGRDLILAHELENLSQQDRDMLACLVGFVRKKVKPTKDLTFSALDTPTQQATLRLAALLRVADGLDYSQSQSTHVQAIHLNDFVDVVVEGAHASADAERANKKADLWAEVLAPPFHARQPHEAAPTHTPAPIIEMEEGLSHQEPITRAGQRLIKTQIEKFVACEDAVRLGGDVDAVHDMRVAARRMRSAFRLLRPYYAKKDLRGINKPLRAIARRLGAVRDIDVLIKNARVYADALRSERQAAFERLIADWYERRQEAQHAVIAFLDGKAYKVWKGRMRAFLKPKVARPAPRVCDEVPILVWEHYTEVRTYEARLGDAALPVLHELRIECKRLRYVLEFFANVLGDETPLLVESLTALQDHLGELHDADVASQRVIAFIAQQTADPQGTVDSAVLYEATAYLNTIQRRIAELHDSFLEHWQAIVDSSFRQKLAEAVAAL